MAPNRWDTGTWIATTRECPTCHGHGRIPIASLSDPCPIPDVAGWTMRQCFAAHRCSCAQGAALGYQPLPNEAPPIEPERPPVSDWTKDEFGNPSRTIGSSD